MKEWRKIGNIIIVVSSEDGNGKKEKKRKEKRTKKKERIERKERKTRRAEKSKDKKTFRVNVKKLHSRKMMEIKRNKDRKKT